MNLKSHLQMEYKTVFIIYPLCFCPVIVVHNEVQQQQQRSNGDGTLSPTSNQLARWFSPELLAQGIFVFFFFYFTFGI